MFTADSLQGKIVLVTGGGSGLGLSMAKRFASLGARVAICGRDQAKLDGATSQLGTDALSYQVDVRDDAAVGKMFDELESVAGGVNVLVNNAAGNFLASSEELSANAFKSVVDIVLNGSFHCTRHFGKRLIDRKLPGAVLSIVTTYAETGSAFVLPSACAKAGVLAMTKSLAAEWAEYGIRVNAIAPGPFPTEGAWSRLVPLPALEDAFKKRVPLGRFGEHEELTHLATFLVSDMASFITGESITVDGGEHLNAGQFNFVTQLFPRAQLKEMFTKMRGPTK
ncbi:MAG: SDR family oxidoreductase [Bdellovibrionota bacterium]